MNTVWSSSNFREILPDRISVYSQSLLPWLFNNAIRNQYESYGFSLSDRMMPVVEVFSRKPYFNMTALQILVELCWHQNSEDVVKAIGGAYDPKIAENLHIKEGRRDRAGLLIRVFKALSFGCISVIRVSKEWRALERENWRCNGERNKDDCHIKILSCLEIKISEYLLRHLYIGVLTTAILNAASRVIRIFHPEMSHNQAQVELGVPSDAPNIQQQRDFHELVQLLAIKKSKLSECGAIFDAKFDDYLAKYGHRCVYEMEVAQERQKETPEDLLREIEAAYKAGVESNLYQLKPNEDSKDRRKGARATKLRKTLLQTLLAYITGRLVSSREKSKFLLTRRISALREELLIVGESGSIKGLRDPKDIFLLTREEIYRLLSGDIPDARVLVCARKAYCQPRMPDTFEAGDSEPRRRRSSENFRDREVCGIPVSVGRVSGVVRVLNSPKDIYRLKEGDIAAVKALDSCWNALYAIAAGVLTEVGGMMSHAAIMVREQKIPAIFNIPDLFERINDGDEVTIDCGQGLLIIEAQKK